MPTRFLKRAQYPLLGILALYPVLLVLFTIPAVQREFLYLNRIRVPFFADLNQPERYGLAPFKSRNLYLNTSDGETIGAWHVLPRSYYHALETWPPETVLPIETYEEAFKKRPTVLYFHGNAGTRAAYHRVKTYSAMSNTLDCNVLAIDYRGFADSTGTPSEQGLTEDAITAWDYVVSRVAEGKGGLGKAGEEIVLLGQSLGTGVVAGLAGRLADQGVQPRAIVLVAPFSSVIELLREFRLFSIIPVLGPLRALPALQNYLLSSFSHGFDSLLPLSRTTSPTLILHATDDSIIPHSHSSRIFTALNPDSAHTVKERTYPGWGRLSNMSRGALGGDVVWWEGERGGHNSIGWAEGSLDLIKRISGS